MSSQKTGAPEAKETKETTKKRNFFHFETSVSFKKLFVWLLIFGFLIFWISQLKPIYKPPSYHGGFYWGVRAPGAYLWIFYYDLKQGMTPLMPGDRVCSDFLEVYGIAKYDMNITITILMFTDPSAPQLLKSKNITLREKALMTLRFNITKVIKFSTFEVQKFKIQLPSVFNQLLYCVLYVNHEEILQFEYETHPLAHVITIMQYQLLSSQLFFAVVIGIVTIAGIAASKFVSEIMPTPDPDAQTAILLFMFIGFFAWIFLDTLVITYGVTSAWIVLPIIFVIAFFAGIYLVSPKSKQILLIRYVDVTDMTAEAFILRCKYIKPNYYLTPNLFEFLLKKPVVVELPEIDLEFKVEGDVDMLYYIKELRAEGLKVEIEPQDVHFLLVEEYKTNAETIEALSKAVDELSEENRQLHAQLEIAEHIGVMKYKITKKKIKQEVVKALITSKIVTEKIAEEVK